MDLLKDIVERDVDGEDVEVAQSEMPVKGFPDLYKPEKISSWKQRLRSKQSGANKAKSTRREAASVRPAASTIATEKPRSEAHAIHQENLDLINNMSSEQIMQERKELLEGMDPKLIQNLLNNINKRSTKIGKGTPLFAEIEGAPGTWIGGTSDINDLPHLDDEAVDRVLGVQPTGKKSVSFAESSEKKPNDIEILEKNVENVESDLDDNYKSYDEDADDIAPLDYQMAQSVDHMTNEELMKDVHFIKHSKHNSDSDINLEKLDINDPNFDDKLHQKYFPDLPKEIDKLAWMQPVDNDEQTKIKTIDDVTSLRFDFKGNLVPPNREIKSTTHSALHHHSQDPHLAGYTIPELARLVMSQFPQQRSISIQILGRILYKMGKQTYYQLVPEVDADTYEELGNTKEVMNKIYGFLWDLCKDCEIIQALKIAADPQFTSHLTVRTYATEALWLWSSGGGDFRKDLKETP